MTFLGFNTLTEPQGTLYVSLNPFYAQWIWSTAAATEIYEHHKLNVKLRSFSFPPALNLALVISRHPAAAGDLSVLPAGHAGDCFWERQPCEGLLPGGDPEKRQAEGRGSEPHPAQPRAGDTAQPHYQRDSLDQPQSLSQCVRYLSDWCGAWDWRLHCVQKAPSKHSVNLTFRIGVKSWFS